jgi:type I restriction enzyme S subunit
VRSGRHKPYPEYNDSGTKWLGKLPRHWTAKRLGQFFEERREKVSDKHYAPLSVTMQGIVPQLETAAKTDDGDNRKLVRANDFVINSRSDRKGSAGVSPLDGSVSLISTVLTPRNIEPRYVHHLLRSYPFQEEYYRFGKGIVADLWSTNYSEMKNILIPELPLTEQIQIAKFLDHETAKIDRLIEKQEALIALLEEKRQAVISHAVTKGLNPHAPLKDSGIEWLGQVPAHWELMKGSWIGQLFGSEPVLESAVTDEGDTPYIKVSTLSAEGFELGEREFFLRNSVSKKYRPSSDYIVFPKRGAAIFTNKVNIVSLDSVIDPNLMGWKIGSRALPQFVAYLLKLRGLGDIADVSTVPQINNKHIDPIIFPIPDLDEQASIIAFLTDKTDGFKKLILRAEEAIVLMQERRTVLISAAVTGKIDVRHWQPHESEFPRANFKSPARHS